MFVITYVHVHRLVHQDGSLADLTMLSGNSAEATMLSGEEPQPPEEQGECGKQEKEKERGLVVMINDAGVAAEKPRRASDPRQSSTEESQACSAGTEPEPSTEQSSGAERLQLSGKIHNM